MILTERIRASRMREICMSGLKRAEEAVSLPLRYSTHQRTTPRVGFVRCQERAT